MIVYPAIDLRGGRVVRLTQGRPEAETVYGDDPAAVARQWVSEGAEWLHVVNLDGAFGSGAMQHQALRAILTSVAIPVQFGGGLRSVDDIAAAFDLGVARAILGTVAVTRPALVAEAVQRFGSERIVIGIDARDGQVATHGWQTSSTIPATTLGQQMRELGAMRAIYTDITRDGTLAGINVRATQTMAQATGLRIIASGGVASLTDVEAACALEDSGVEGLIVGRALYAGHVRLADVLAVAAGHRCDTP